MYLQLAFPLSACWHVWNYEAKVWVVTVILLIYSCSMQLFFDILWIPKDPQATPWETTAWKDKVENLYFMYHWSSLVLQENWEEESCGPWFHCTKSRLIVTTKVFLWTKLDKSEVVLQWAHCAHKGERRVLQMHPAPFKAKTVQPTGSGQPFQQELLYRLVHRSSVSPGNGRQ